MQNFNMCVNNKIIFRYKVILLFLVTLFPLELVAQEGFLLTELYLIKNPVVCVLLFVISIIFLYVSFLKEKFLFQGIGFILITPFHQNRIVKVDKKIKTLTEIVKYINSQELKIYSDSSKILFNHKGDTLHIEDKNEKNSILVNRRQHRKIMLFNGDVIDTGQFTLLHINTYFSQENVGKIRSLVVHPDTKRYNNYTQERLPTLEPVDKRKKTIYLTKNVTFIGASKMNDVVLKLNNVALRHAKIQKYGFKTYKILSINAPFGVYVNTQKFEKTYLKNNDLVHFDNVVYKFCV